MKHRDDRVTFIHLMIRVSRYLLYLLLVTLPLRAAAAEATLTGEALVHALRLGGYNIYFRHAATDWSQSDKVERPGDWTSCDPSRIRQLSDEGRDSARAVGKAMRALNIPVGKVLASPYCRTVETATLMDLGPVVTTTDVMNMRVASYFGGRAAIAKTARRRLSVPPAKGTNTVIVAHGNVAREATPVYPGEAEGVVFRPDGDGGFRFVGRLAPAEWTALADKLGGG
jgi:phosphohistidine phosphatase SixA